MPRRGADQTVTRPAHSWYCGIAPFLEQTPMYNSINFSYTVEWVYSGTLFGPNPIDYTVNKASIATLLCPSDGTVNTCSGYAQYINYQPGNFNYVANTGHPRNVLLPGDPANTGSLPAPTGIMSMSPMYRGRSLTAARRRRPRTPASRSRWPASPTEHRTPRPSANRW